MEALEWHLLPERRQQLSSNRTDPRKSTMCKILAVGGMDVNKVLHISDDYIIIVLKITIISH